MQAVQIEAAQKLHYSEVRKRLGMPAKGGNMTLVRHKFVPRPRDFLNLTVEEIIPETQPDIIAAMSWKAVLKQVADKHGITVAELRSKSRKHQYCYARREACYRLAHELGMSYPAVARRVGYGDHTSALTAANLWAASRGYEPSKRLLEEQARLARNAEILRVLNEGGTVSELTKTMGITSTGIRIAAKRMGFDFSEGRERRYRKAMMDARNAQ